MVSLRSLEARLRRITSHGDYVPEVDGLRFVAIMAVVLLHAMQNIIGGRFTGLGSRWDQAAFEGLAQGNPITSVALHGDLGVQLFFVISGFVLALPFARHFLFEQRAVSLRAYYVRRVTRLEPPYILCLVLLFCLRVAADPAKQDLVPRLLAGLTYTHCLVYGTWNPISTVTWSLEIEVQFYLIAPLVAKVFAIRSRQLRTGAWVAAILFWAMLASNLDGHSRVRLSLVGSLQYFIAGFLAADLWLSQWRNTRRSLLWDALGMLGVTAVLLCVRSPGLGKVALPILFVLFLGAAFKGVLLNWLCRLRLATIVGGMCYTIYLYHAVILRGTAPHALRLYVPGLSLGANTLIQWTMLVPCVVVCSAFLFAFVERPCMARDWHVRLWRTMAGLLAVSGRSVDTPTRPN